MKTIPHLTRSLATLSAFVLLVHVALAANFTWTGASGTDLFWSTPGNWTPLGPPGPNDNLGFFDAGSTNDPVAVNNVVSANITVQSLWVGPTLGVAGTTTAAHNTFINPGVTLTVAGAAGTAEGYPLPIPNSTWFVGTKTNVDSTTTVLNTFSGAGTLVVSNLNNELNVRQTHPTAAAHNSVLDLSGLNTFIAHLGRIRVGDGVIDPIRRAQGFLTLARTNHITLSASGWRATPPRDVQLLVGNNDENNNGGAGRHSELVLGQQNFFNMDEILIGARKTEGRMFFNAALTSPSLTLRGSAGGSSRVLRLRVGDHSDQANSGNQSTGNLDLSGGTVDARVETLIVGKSQTQTGGAGNGFLTLGAGTVNVNTLEVAYQTSETANNVVNGTVNLNGTTVVVNNLLRLGRSAGAAPLRNATLNITGGGSVTVNGSYENQGTVNLTLTDSHLSLPAGASILASAVTLNNSAISNVASLTVTNGLTLSAGSVITGDPAFNLGNNPLGNTWEFSATPGLVATKSIAGVGTLTGNMSVAPGAILNPGGSGVGGTLTFSANLTNNAAQIFFDITTNAANLSDDLIAVNGHLALIGTNDVFLNNLGPTIDTNNLYTLATYGTLSGGATNLRAAGKLGNSRYTFNFDTTTQAGAILMDVNLVGAGALNLTWAGDGTANNWDFATANWTSGGTAQFFNLDNVTFNDAGSATPAVNLTTTLSPGSVTVNNPTKSYVFNGPGGIDGTVFVKSGAGSLTLRNGGGNRFIEGVSVQGGAVTFTNSGLNTFGGLTINGGSVTLAGNSTNIFGNSGITVATATSLSVLNSNANTFGSGPITLEGTLTINQPVDATLLGDISGAGSLIKGNNNRLTLRADNSGLSSIIQVNAGTLRAFTATALGSAGAVVANGAALDVNGQNLGAVAITVSGNGPTGAGALVNNDAPNQGGAGLRNVTLTGHTTIGGVGPWFTDPVLNRGRLNIIESSFGAGDAVFSTGGQPFNLTKVGENQLSFTGVQMDAALADIDVQAGAFSYESGTTSLGNSNNTLTVRAGASLILSNAVNPLNKKLVLFGNGVAPTLFNWHGENSIIGMVTLNGTCAVDEAPPVRGTPVSLTLNGAVSGSGGFLKLSPRDTLILAGNNNYSGATTVQAGRLMVNGNNSGTGAVMMNGGTLGGTGRISGPTTVAAGGTLAPGQDNLGTLSINNSLSLSGITSADLDKTGAVLTSDSVTNVTTLVLGGTLQLNITGDPLVAGDSFKLFSFTSASGAFAFIVPTTPGTNLVWDTGTLTTDGRLRVAAAAPAQPRIVSVARFGADIVISGTNGTASGNYHVLTSTNVALPLSSWIPIATNSFSNGNFIFTNTLDPNIPRLFYILRVP